MDCSESEWSLLGYPLHSPLSPSLLLPRVAVCHQIPCPLYHTVVSKPILFLWQLLLPARLALKHNLQIAHRTDPVDCSGNVWKDLLHSTWYRTLMLAFGFISVVRCCAYAIGDKQCKCWPVAITKKYAVTHHLLQMLVYWLAVVKEIKSANNAVNFLVTVKAQWEQNGGRLLLGDDTGGEAVTLWPSRFLCAEVWISTRLKGWGTSVGSRSTYLPEDTCCVIRGCLNAFCSKNWWPKSVAVGQLSSQHCSIAYTHAHTHTHTHTHIYIYIYIYI